LARILNYSNLMPILGDDTIYKKRLQALLQITRAINANFSREQLLRIFTSLLRNQLRFEKIAVYSDPKTRIAPELILGAPLEFLNDFNVQQLVERIQDPNEILYLGDHTTDFFQVAVPIFHKDKPLAVLLLQRSQLPDRDEEDFIQALCNIIFVALENKQLAREGLQQERLKKELELAAHLQARLLPLTFPGTGAVEADAFYKTHTEVGGDYYDFFKCDDGSYALCMADVSGKGVSAALLMSNFQANFKALFPYFNDLGLLAETLNRKVNDTADGEKFITAFIARYHPPTHKLFFVNCGHNPPLFAKNKAESFSWIHSGTIGLGMLDELPFISTGVLDLEPEAMLVMYTDGLTELQNAEGNYFGQEALKEFTQQHRTIGIKDFTTQLILKLESFKSGNEYHDDVALMACRFF
jgi:sigma-B regulation protein RsbU (phosphoserine phosphatase)